MRKSSHILAGTCTLLIAGCSMLPVEPTVDYNHTGVDLSSQLRVQANHTVPGMHVAHVSFPSGSNRLDGQAAAELMPLVDAGVQSVRIVAPTRDSRNDERQLALKRFLRGHGIEGRVISASHDSKLEANTYRVEFSTMEVMPPDCPNWSSSASTSYSNMPWSQLGCANVSNIGAMVENPRDLMQGSGNARADAARNSVAIQQYHSNKDWTPAAAGGGASASNTQFGGGGNGSTSVPGQSGSGTPGAGSN